MNHSLNPYLHFNGNATEAMNFYHSILGGELSIQTYADAQQSEDPQYANLVMHASLKDTHMMLMASDGRPGSEVKFGDNVHLSLTDENETSLKEIFQKLSEDGTVTMPMDKQFWGDTFGMVTDKFGVHWMINVLSEESSKQMGVE